MLIMLISHLEIPELKSVTTDIGNLFFIIMLYIKNTLVVVV